MQPRARAVQSWSLAAALVAPGCGGDAPTAICLPRDAPAPFTLALRDHWSIQSSALVAATDAQVSSSAFHADGWHATSLPSTVLAALVQDGVYPDPYFGMNLHSLPGNDGYAIGTPDGFAMADGSPFRPAWWYRTSFPLPAIGCGQRVSLRFDGINYRADVYLNGHLIADHQRVAGTFRSHELDVTGAAIAGGDNVLAVKVTAPETTDLAFNWVDWNPFPPDKNMGVWGDVTLQTTGSVHLRSPQVISHFDLPALDPAHLTATVEAQNVSGDPVECVVSAELDGLSLSQSITLGAGESRVVRFTPDRFDALNVARPRLWWPAPLGPQELHRIAFRAAVGGQLSDEAGARFGIREVTSELTPDNHRLFRVNGRPLLIRGAGWAPDMMLRAPPGRLEDEVRYIKDMNLNAIRLEGKLGFDRLLDACDEQGILVLAGWCCCDVWEMPERWTAEDHPVAVQSLGDQIRRLRNHPSMLVWLNGSDNIPPPALEQQYLDTLAVLAWPNPSLASANTTVSPISGVSGVKMTGPYLWVPPMYWSTVDYLGGAFGFNTETSVGAAIPELESLKKFIPPEHRWPIDDFWLYHSGSGQFRTLDNYLEALDRRYGPSAGIEEFERRSQLSSYEGVRAMFEAYGRNKYVATGVIQWMLDNAWPSLIWHLYDYFLKPGGGYFGAKKACEPLHIQYSYNDRAVAIVNSTARSFHQLRARASVLNLDMTERHAQQKMIDVPDDGSVVAFGLPEIANLDTTYFVDLTLEDSSGAVIDRNLYWLSTQPDVLDKAGSTFSVTPTVAFADLTGIARLPSVPLQAQATRRREGEDEVVSVTLANPGAALAFFVRLEVTRGLDGEEVLPIRYDDNDVSLRPGEARPLTARYRVTDLDHSAPAIRLTGWNVPSVSLAVP